MSKEQLIFEGTFGTWKPKVGQHIWLIDDTGVEREYRVTRVTDSGIYGHTTGVFRDYDPID